MPRRTDPLKKEIAELAFTAFKQGETIGLAKEGYEFIPVGAIRTPTLGLNRALLAHAIS